MRIAGAVDIQTQHLLFRGIEAPGSLFFALCTAANVTEGFHKMENFVSAPQKKTFR